MLRLKHRWKYNKTFGIGGIGNVDKDIFLYVELSWYIIIGMFK
jgi:hypothetical protein